MARRPNRRGPGGVNEDGILPGIVRVEHQPQLERFATLDQEPRESTEDHAMRFEEHPTSAPPAVPVASPIRMVMPQVET